MPSVRKRMLPIVILLLRDADGYGVFCCHSKNEKKRTETGNKWTLDKLLRKCVSRADKCLYKCRGAFNSFGERYRNSSERKIKTRLSHQAEK